MLEILKSMQQTFKDYQQGCVDREREREERRRTAIKAEKKNLVQKLFGGVWRVAGRCRSYLRVPSKKRGKISRPSKREGKEEDTMAKTE